MIIIDNKLCVIKGRKRHNLTKTTDTFQTVDYNVKHNICICCGKKYYKIPYVQNVWEC